MRDISKEIGREILDAIGIPIFGVRSITIRIVAGKAPTVEIEKLIQTEEKIAAALSGYKLTEIANEP